MENLYFGIITIIICVIGYYISWKNFLLQRYTYALGFIILCGLILRVYVATDFYLHPWDERYHALVAKNLIGHPLIPTLYEKVALPYDYRIWIENHIWLHKQPLPLWGMALSMWLFGINEFALRLPSIIITSIGIWLIYCIGRYLFNRKVGFIAAFLYSIHGLIIEMTGGRVATDHIDIFFLFFIELAVFYAITFAKTKVQIFNVLCGLSVGAAILSKWFPALIVLPLWLIIICGSKKFKKKEILINFFLLCTIIAIIFIPWQLYIYSAFPEEARWEMAFNIKHIAGIEGHSQPFYYHFNKLRINFGEIIYIPLVWFLIKTTKNVKNHNRLLLTIWFLVPYLFFSIVKTKMQAYTLFAAPAIFIITAVFWQYLFQYRNKFKFTWMIYTVLFLLLALPIKYSIERIKPFEISERNPEYTKEIRKLKNGYNKPNTILFNTDYPIETMFYTDITAYSGIPELNTLNSLIDKGYEIIINDKGDIIQEIKRNKKINIIKLTGDNK